MVLHQNLSFLSSQGELRTIVLKDLLEEHSDYQLYDAIVEEDEMRVAVKLSPSTRCQRLRAEGLALRFAHSHGVPHTPLYLGEATNEHHLLVSELVEGPTLEEELLRLYPSGLPLPRALEWTYELLSFSASLSKAGFLHLALHPRSILLPGGVFESRDLKIVNWSHALPVNTVQDISTVIDGREAFQGELIRAEKPPHATGYQPSTRCLTDSIDLYAIGMTLVALLVGAKFFEQEHEMNSLHWHALLRDERAELFEKEGGDITAGEAIERFLSRLIIERRDFRRDVRYLSPFENSTSSLLAFDRMCEKIISDSRLSVDDGQEGDLERLAEVLLGYLGREGVANMKRPDKVVYRLPNTKGWNFD